MQSLAKAGDRGRMRDTCRLIAVCSVILLLAIVIIYPWMFAKWIKRTLSQREPPHKTASAVALGVAMSVMPIWSFQMLAAVGLAHIFKLNKVVAAAFSNASLPPFIPFIIYSSLCIGGFVTGENAEIDFANVTMENMADSLRAYATGAVILGLLLGLTTWPLAYLAAKTLNRRRTGGK